MNWPLVILVVLVVGALILENKQQRKMRKFRREQKIKREDEIKYTERARMCALLSSEAWASSFDTLGQYRTKLIAVIQNWDY